MLEAATVGMQRVKQKGLEKEEEIGGTSILKREKDSAWLGWAG